MTRDPLDIFLVAGEPSGDMQASLVAAELRRMEPGIRLRGAAGPRMRAAGVVAEYQSDDWGSVGLVPALARVPRLHPLMREMALRLAKAPPNLLLLVDFGAFNVRLARRVRQAVPGVPILYYFPPGSWNPGPRDRGGLAPLVEAVATPFAYSEQLLRQDGVPAWWVGHPALDRLGPPDDRQAFRRQQGIEGSPVIGLLPGSRQREERRFLAPQMLGALSLLQQRLPEATFLWSVMPGVPLGVADRRAAEHERVRVVDDSTLILKSADLVLTAMGTATLEAAVTGCLPICAYRGNLAMWLQWRALGVGTDLYAMPNIMLRQRVFPELLQSQASAAGLAAEALELWHSPARQAELHAALGQVRAQLGVPGASRRVARMALRVARGEKLSLEESFATDPVEAGVTS
ncbi:MAG: hypothetical protein GX100_11935 [candidate division WS1 bacterium]|nr:hypothetical protein [candidate division WS1 bacterium]